MSRLSKRLGKLERVRDDRAHLLAEPYPAHTKEPINYAAVTAITRKLFATAPMVTDAALALVLSSIPKPLRTPDSTDDHHPYTRTANSGTHEEDSTA